MARSARQTDIPKINIPDVADDRQDEVVVSRFAPYLHNHRNLALPHRHSFFHLLFFTKGDGFHTIDFRQFPVRPQQAYFMVPGQVHSWNFQGDVDGYVVNFSENFFSSFLLRPDYMYEFSFFSGDAARCVLQLSDEPAAEAAALFEKLLRTFQSSIHLENDLLRAQLLQLLLGIEQSTAHLPETLGALPANQLLAQYRRLIETHFRTWKRPGDYAPLLHISPNHLNALCKEHLGIRAGVLIRERIALEAKRLLVNMDITVAEVAYKLDFDDNSYFSKFFKKQTGLTPELFRAQFAALRS